MIKTKFTYSDEALIAFFTFHLKRKDKIRWIYYILASLFMIAGVVVAFVFNNKVFGFIMYPINTQVRKATIGIRILLLKKSNISSMERPAI